MSSRMFAGPVSPKISKSIILQIATADSFVDHLNFSNYSLDMNRWSIKLIIFIIFLSVCEISWARAGGGQSSSGGLAGFLLGILALPFIIPFLLYMAYVNLKLNKRSKEVCELLLIMKKEEHQWSEEKILNTAKSLFMRIQNAWCAKNLNELKDLLHSDLYPSWEMDINNQIKRNERDEMEAVSVNRMRIVDIKNTLDEESTSFSICFDAQAKNRIYREERLYSKNDKPFREFWTFRWHEGQWQLSEVAPASGWRRFMHSHLVYEKGLKRKKSKFQKLV